MYKIIIVVLLLVLIFPLQNAVSQELILSEKAKQKSVEVYISREGNVHVKHVIEKSDVPKQISLISGIKDNIKISDVDGNDIQHAMIGTDSGVMFFPTNNRILVEYDLSNALTQEEGVWTWDFLYLESTKFFFPDNIDMIFVSNKPVLLDENRGINCHGCQMKLEYFEENNVQYEKVIWKDYKFTVPILSLTEVESFSFDQPGKSISFKVNEVNKFVTIIMPLELLWKPYQVYLEDEKIFKHDYITNGTHVWINLKPQSTGEVTIIGTTAVPEFSLFLPLVLGITLIVFLQFRNKITLR